MDGEATGRAVKARARRWAIDLAMLAAIGLLMGFLAPFASERAPVARRYLHWMICMVGGGVIGIVIDDLLARRMTASWRRVVAVAALMTPPVTLLVLATEHTLSGAPFDWPVYGWLFRQVGPIVLAMMAVRALVWRRVPARIETRTVVAAPLPDAEAAFRRRLSARRRQARLIAVEAHDHYLKVHTDAGDELITLRFSDALAELAQAPRLARPPLVVGGGAGCGGGALAAGRGRDPPGRRSRRAGQPHLCSRAEGRRLVLRPAQPCLGMVLIIHGMPNLSVKLP
jgi:hypothetical protein